MGDTTPTKTKSVFIVPGNFLYYNGINIGLKCLKDMTFIKFGISIHVPIPTIKANDHLPGQDSLDENYKKMKLKIKLASFITTSKIIYCY